MEITKENVARTSLPNVLCGDIISSSIFLKVDGLKITLCNESVLMDNNQNVSYELKITL